MTATAKLLKQETARAAAYRQLAEAFCPPSPALPDGLREMASALALLESAAAPDVARLVDGRCTEENRHTLTIDHAALFVGPFSVPAPPYGSVYLENDRRLMGNSTADARKQYLDLGFDLSPDFKDAPDHICAELEFMSLLIRQEMEAIGNGDYRLLSENIRRQKTFLIRHLGAWVPEFADRVRTHARTDFYRFLASVTETFVAEEIDALPEIPEERAGGSGINFPVPS